MTDPGRGSLSRAFFWLTASAGVVLTLVAWFVLPDRVPLHFGGSGDVDRWGSRTEAVVTMGVVLGGFVLAFWALAAVMPRLPGSMINLPTRHKAWWLAEPDRRRELDRRMAGDLHFLGGCTLLLLVFVEAMTMVVARQADPSLGVAFWMALVVYLAVVSGWTTWMVAVRYRPPADSG